MRRALLLIGLSLLLGCQQEIPNNRGILPRTSSSSAAAMKGCCPGTRIGIEQSVSATSASPEVLDPKNVKSHAGDHVPFTGSFVLSVPFSPQAPNAYWDDFHNEACEEASLLMVHHFLEGTPLSREQTEQEIQDIVAWQTERGYGYDVNVVELKAIAERYFGYRGRIELDPSPGRIRELIVQGHPVIVPVAGRLLGNPNFRGEGPWYHMLVIRGYRQNWLGRNIFITNDPGTRKGERYEYREEVLMSALHDWTGVKEEIRSGRKAILIVEQ